MSKEVKTEQKYSKTAFVEVAADGKERLILQIVLDDGESYSKDEATEKVAEWKKKEVKA